MKLVQKAKAYAIECHSGTNHLYDGKPYQTHLDMVVDTAKEFYYPLIPSEREIVLASCWTHDIIEDCRQTYNDVKRILGEDVADIVFAVTNEKGKSRKERANEKYYHGIKQIPNAPFVKICDRIANMKYSLDNKSQMAVKYAKEFPDFFKNFLYFNELTPLLQRCEELTYLIHRTFPNTLD